MKPLPSIDVRGRSRRLARLFLLPKLRYPHARRGSERPWCGFLPRLRVEEPRWGPMQRCVLVCLSSTSAALRLEGAPIVLFSLGGEEGRVFRLDPGGRRRGHPEQRRAFFGSEATETLSVRVFRTCPKMRATTPAIPVSRSCPRRLPLSRGPDPQNGPTASRPFHFFLIPVGEPGQPDLSLCQLESSPKLLPTSRQAGREALKAVNPPASSLLREKGRWHEPDHFRAIGFEPRRSARIQRMAPPYRRAACASLRS